MATRRKQSEEFCRWTAGREREAIGGGRRTLWGIETHLATRQGSPERVAEVLTVHERYLPMHRGKKQDELATELRLRKIPTTSSSKELMPVNHRLSNASADVGSMPGRRLEITGKRQPNKAERGKIWP